MDPQTPGTRPLGDRLPAVYVLDAYGLVFRAYFAFIRNPLRNSRGENTSAVFGFFRTVLALLREEQPTHFIVALDSRTPTVREQLYADYKATRDATPEDLISQFPIIEAALAAMRLPTIRIDGYEADDIMATVARRCRAASRQCVVVSADKDMLQLVDDHVSVLRPGQGGFTRIDRAAVFAERGVYPDQIRDYLALIGDTSDNIPGVKGIGPKTAAELLARFATLDGIYADLTAVASNSQRAKLESGREQADLSRRLVTLHDELDLPLAIEDMTLTAVDGAAAAMVLEQHDIKNLAAELRAFVGPGGDKRGAAAVPAATACAATACAATACAATACAVRGEYRCVTTVDELAEWVAAARRAGRCAFDSETDSLDSMRAQPVGFSLAYAPGHAAYIPIKGPAGPVLTREQVLPLLTTLLTDPTVLVVGQNIKYDFKVFARWGLRITAPLFDTMVAAWLLDAGSGSYGMDALAQRYLNYQTISYQDVVGKPARGVPLPTFDQVPLDKATEYAAEDADITLRLYELFAAALFDRRLNRLMDEIEMPLVPILADMEMAGVGVDVFALATMSDEFAARLQQLEQEVFALVGHSFNLSSTKQLQDVLFVERKLRPVKKTKTGYSTDTSVLEELAADDPVPQLVLQHRTLAKLKSTYIDALPTMVHPQTGRIHTDFHQTGTATGRLSSKDPNLQNIPIRDEAGRRIRSAFVPPPGKRFVSADYAQIELVVLAHLAQDPGLLRAFATGQDVHRETGALIFGVEPAMVSADQRRIAKTINFGVMYGMSAFRLARELGISRSDATQFIETYFRTYSAIQQFIRDTVEQAEKTGFVTTLLGRERRVPGITGQNKTEKAAAERVAVNTPIQGSAADIVKTAMIRIARRLHGDERARLVLQVHDEVILECDEDAVDAVSAMVREEMVNAVQLSVPLRVNVESGAGWGDMH